MLSAGIKKYCFLILFLVSFITGKAQTDTIFWFAVPYATISHDWAHYSAALIISATDNTQLTHVTIEQPFNPQIAARNFTIDPAVNMTRVENFTSADVLNISNNIYNSVENCALLIKSDREITAYYEFQRFGNNPEIFSLKGTNALGKDFWVPFQNRWPNHDWDLPANDPAFSQINIVATEDNTEITIRFKKNAFGYAANTDYTITLNRGETYKFVPRPNAADNNEPSYLVADRLVGTHITSNKPISVTTGDDSVQKDGAYDYIGDQIIPLRNLFDKPIVGHEYIIMKGQVDDDNGNEKAFIMATQSNTSVHLTWRDGTTQNIVLANPGDQQMIDLLIADNDYYVHVDADKPVYVFHVSGFGDELGGTTLPTIDGCTGSLSVNFVRSKNQAFYLNLMVKEDAIDSFYISVNNAPPVKFLDASKFERAGTSSWFVLKNSEKLFGTAVIPVNQTIRIFNTKNVFHLGMINGVTSGGGCIYGYFSDYNELEAKASVEDQGAVFQVCEPDSVILKADGGISYSWNPTDYIDDPHSQNAVLRPPPGGFNQIFSCEIEQPCNGYETKYVWVIIPGNPNAYFSLNTNRGCAPLDVSFHDASSEGNSYVLDFGDGSDLVVSTDPININHTFENNTNDSINYIVTYTVGNDEGCNDFFVDTITVYPKITSSFVLTDWNDTTGCHPLNVEFQNTSSGNTDKYFWDFGDGASSIDTNVTHIFQNISSTDTYYDVKLIATSPFLCSDTSATVRIRTLPYIKADFSIDSTKSCSPALFYINPSNSTGVQDYNWHYYDADYSCIDSVFTKNNKNTFSFYHNDNTQPDPDTIFISMDAESSYGCYDTAETKMVIVYPELHSVFDVSETTVCDSTEILFTNHSIGFNPRFIWDFGDGTSASDVTGNDYPHLYLNRTDFSKDYHVILTVVSDFYCSVQSDTTIKVHPYIDADFTTEYPNTCSPLNATIINHSHRVQDYFWDFGNGITGDSSSASFVIPYVNPLPNSEITYTIKLNVLNAEGCADSTSKSITLSPAVVASFTMDKKEDCNPLTVHFDNQSTGSLFYKWNFNNVLESAETGDFDKTFEHFGGLDSTIVIQLTATNQFGCKDSISDTVVVYSYVDADFTVARIDSCSPFYVRATNRTPAGASLFRWNFGDGSSEFTGYNPPVHRYNHIGAYNVPDIYNLRLHVENSHGCADDLTKSITVYPDVFASFSVDSIKGCQPLDMVATNTNWIPDATVNSYYWDFGDGSYSNVISTNQVPHTYYNNDNVPVIRNLSLRMENKFGCSDDTVRQITIYPYLFANFSVSKTAVCSDEEFIIDRSSSQGGITEYRWDFNTYNGLSIDSTTSGAIFTKTFFNASEFDDLRNIQLTVLYEHTNGDICTRSHTNEVIVHPDVNSAFSFWENDSVICYPEEVQLINDCPYFGSVETKFFWNFDDGNTSTEDNPVVNHLFRNFSYYNNEYFNITLIAESEPGCRDTISHLLTINPQPKADFNFDETADCPPFLVPFTGSSQGNNLLYRWNFDDGQSAGPSSDPDISHIFYNNGSSIVEREIKLIAETEYGCKDSLTKPINIYPKVTVDFEADKWEGCSPLVVNFEGDPTNGDNLYWYIDGTAFSTLDQPSYRFVNNTSGSITYDIKFKANSLYNCTDDTTKQVIVYPTPEAEFIPSPVLQYFNTETDITPVNIKNFTPHQNSGTWEYTWNYGDGETNNNTSEDFNKEYTIWGPNSNGNKIPISLLVKNREYPACADSIQHEVIIIPPLPQVNAAEDIAGCMPFFVSFSSSTKYIYENSYFWDFGNGDTSRVKQPKYVFRQPGTYNVKLRVEGDGGINWDYKLVTVYEKPLAEFTFSPGLVMEESRTEEPTPVKFFNTTRNGNEYIWDFGDETPFDFEKEPSHIYADTGHFYVTLFVTSSEGCMDTLVHSTPVVVEGARLLKFPNAIVIHPDIAADEYYDHSYPDPRIFRPVSRGVEKYRLEIYNRWGELIFVSEDVNKGWNGYVNGMAVKQDVYVWRATATFSDGKPMILAGDVTVLVNENIENVLPAQ